MAQNDFDRAADAVGGIASSWVWVLIYGIFLLLAGALALYDPTAAGLATGIFFGFGLIAYGVLAIIVGSAAIFRASRTMEILLGLLAIVGGVVVLMNPAAGTASIGWAIGFWLMVSGIVELVFAFRGIRDRMWRIALGLLHAVLGGYLVFTGPANGFLFVATLVGISFVFRGIFMMTLALGMRKVSQL